MKASQKQQLIQMWIKHFGASKTKDSQSYNRASNIVGHLDASKYAKALKPV